MISEIIISDGLNTVKINPLFFLIENDQKPGSINFLQNKKNALLLKYADVWGLTKLKYFFLKGKFDVPFSISTVYLTFKEYPLNIKIEKQMLC